jgi:Mrp family chromosome partitioning ATPase
VSSEENISKVVPDETPGSNALTHGGPHASDKQFDFWCTIHRALRGHYRLALLLAAGGVAAGSFIGFKVGRRLYASNGLVRIASVLPQVMYATDQNAPLAMFDGFMAAQREEMCSRAMIQAALHDPVWNGLAKNRPVPTIGEFAAGLKVEARFRSEYLKITYSDRDPLIATAGVQSIIGAYQRTYVRDHDRSEAQRLAELKARHIALTNELETLQAEVDPEASGLTLAEMEPVYTAATDRAKKLRATLVDLQCAIAGLPSAAGTPAPAPPAERTPADLVADALLHSAIEAQARAESELSAARSLGYGEAHPSMVRLQAAVVECRRRVQQCVQDYPSRRPNLPLAPSPLELVERAARLHRQIQASEKETQQIDARRAQLAAFQEKAAALAQNLKATDARIDALSTESSLSSRLTVVSAGDEPVAPSLDNRARCAAVGGLIGLGLPLGFLALAGSIRRRYRYGDDLARDLRSRVPFVALVPEVIEGGAMNSAAARCIHSLRVRLQGRNSEESGVFLLTSTSGGEGTSGLAISLALSASAAGLKALVIDCNLNSRGLTLGFDAGSEPGMLEALAGERPLVHRVEAGFYFMAAGQARWQDAFAAAASSLACVLAVLKQTFDLILIDGEPILTSAISSTIAPEVDGVCLTLARGQRESLLDAAVRQIEILQAQPAAVVFNRAADSDFPAAMHQETPPKEGATREVPARLKRFGALVGGVMKSLSLSRETDLDLGSLRAQAAEPETTSEAA